MLIHPTAYISPSAKIEKGTIVEPKALVNANSLIKRGSIISVGAIVDHDVLVNECCHVNAGAICKAGSNIEDCRKLEAGEVVKGIKYVQVFFKKSSRFYLSLSGIFVLALPMIVIAIAVKLDSPGPVLFRQKRVGIHKTYFNILKFRTMRTDTPHDAPTHLLQGATSYITKWAVFYAKPVWMNYRSYLIFCRSNECSGTPSCLMESI